MTTTRHLASCVLAGQINRFILQPEWMEKVGLFAGEDSKPGVVQVHLPVDGSPQHRIETPSLLWTVESGKLQVAANSDSADPGAKVADLLGILGHTPVIAVGNNFVYECTGFDLLPSLKSAQLETLQRAMGGEAAVQHLILRSPIDDGARPPSNMQVTAEPMTSGTLIRFNFHRVAADAAEAGRHARRWKDDRDVANEIVKRLTT
jgi:hypothetical protein